MKYFECSNDKPMTFLLIAGLIFFCRASIPECNSPPLKNTIKTVELRTKLAKQKEQSYKESTGELLKINQRARVTAYTSTALAVVGVSVGATAGAAAGGVIVVAPSFSAGTVTGAQVVETGVVMSEFLSSAGVAIIGTSEVLRYSSISEAMAKARDLAREHNAEIYSVNDIEREVEKFIEKIDQRHAKTAQLVNKDLAANKPGWWKLGWDDLAYTETQLKGYETHRILYQADQRELEKLGETLKRFCAEFERTDRREKVSSVNDSDLKRHTKSATH